jgi:APA family basic amino acid/polyamine antiporter
MVNDNKEKISLLRQMGVFDSTMMMVGIVIGSGIFLTTGIMAQSIPSAGLILLTWFFGGLIVLAGALTYAEMGAAMPEAGGQYVYLKQAYGPLYGFLFGWNMFLVSMSGSIAALAAAFAEYFGFFFPSLSNQEIIFSTTLNILNHSHVYSLSMGQIIAVTIIIILSGVNYIGAAPGKIIQNILTMVKIGIITAFIILGFTIGTKTRINFDVDALFHPGGLNPGQLIVGCGIALIAVFWAFDGWHNINYIAGEIKKPQRNLPYSLVMGTLIITVLYVSVNVVYLLALPVEEMKGVVRIAEKAANSLFGKATTGVLSAAVLISILGALHGAVFVGPRVYYAMAKDKLFFQRAARVHPRFRTPGFAILCQAIWSCFLCLTGTFEQLFTFAMFINILFWTAAAASVFKLRKKYPELPRPYKTWGYPVTPLVFIIVLLIILVNTLIKKPVESLAGLGLAVIGIPIYYTWRKSKVNTG